MSKKPSAYILYGFAEGPRVAQRMIKALHNAGIEITNNCPQADMLIAHSAGCFKIPKNTKAKAVLLIGPSSGFSGASLIKVQARKVGQDFSNARQTKALGAWFIKSAWNMMYLASLATQISAILRQARQLKHTLPKIDGAHTAVFLYRDDPWSWYLPADIAKQHPEYSYISHPGTHDDLWTNPKEYIAVLQYLHEA